MVTTNSDLGVGSGSDSSFQGSKYQGGRHLFLIHLDLFSMPPLALYGTR